MKFLGQIFFLIVNFVLLTQSARALVIIPTWDASITNDPNAALIEGTINAAIQFFEGRFADSITVNIKYQEMSDGLGASQTYFYTIPYATFISLLKKDATTTNDTYALAHLPTNVFNPVTGDADIYVNTANLKAIGITTLNSQLPSGVDGIISLNTSIMNLSRPLTNFSAYDLLSVVEHEMNEVLTLGSELPDTTHPFPQDLFRYNSSGARSFTTAGDDAYFSLDGTNLLVRFNQQPDGDYGDWWSNGGQTPRVQDAFATAGAAPDPNIELVALDVQGFDLLPAPVPRIAGITLNGANLTVSATKGMATGTYYLLTSTDLTVPLRQWQNIATNFVTNNGAFTFTATNAVFPNAGAQFYILQLR